jgi:hypothetical protein
MRTLGIVLVLSASVPCLPAQDQGSSAQGQASPAPQKKDQDKTKATTPRKPVPSYTEEDLKKAREGGRGNVVILPPLPPDANPAAGKEAESETDAREVARQSWQEQVEQRRQAIVQAEKTVQEVEARIGELTSDIAPNPGDLLDPSRLQKREAEKQRLLKELVGIKANLEAARKGLADLEEKGPRQGVKPPS